MRSTLIALDFDGTMVDTIDAKISAFNTVYRDISVQFLSDHHETLKQNFGEHRELKWQRLNSYLRSRSLETVDYHKFSSSISACYRDVIDWKIAAAPDLDLFFKFVESQSLCELCIVSSAPADEIDSFFAENPQIQRPCLIYSAVKDKASLLRLITDEHVEIDQFWMVGDTKSDQDAAANASWHFVMVDLAGDVAGACHGFHQVACAIFGDSFDGLRLCNSQRK